MTDNGATTLQQAIDAPWRITNELRRLLVLPYVQLLFAFHGMAWGNGWRVFGVPLIQRHRGSRIELGDRLELRSTYGSNPLSPNHPVVLATRTAAATIRIGDDCGFTGTTLVAAERIEIGNHVIVGANVTIVDTDFHPLHPAERRRDILNGQHQRIIIEDDVFIGMHSIILKGVTIGVGSVVGAGSIVTHNVPPGVIVAGNPACIVRTLQD